MQAMSESVATLATRETDYLSLVTRQTSSIFVKVHTTRPQKILRTLKKAKSASGEPVTVFVYDKPHGVFARELLHNLLKKGADIELPEDEED